MKSAMFGFITVAAILIAPTAALASHGHGHGHGSGHGHGGYHGGWGGSGHSWNSGYRGGGWGGHGWHHHHHHHGMYRSPIVYPPVFVPYYGPRSSFFYSGRNATFGFGF